MKVEDRYYEVSPKIVRGDAEAVIEIKPRFEHCQFRDKAAYRLTYAPVEEFAERSGWRPGEQRAIQPVDGKLRIRQYFESEQEHVLYVEEIEGDSCKCMGDFRVYSLEPDLYGRQPYKGDFHLHSCRSDGRESPGYVAAACRRIGLDFMAVTDHRVFEPSLEAQKAFEGIEVDLRIFTGEEIHPPENHVHMINFGGRFGINALFRDEAAYHAEVDALQGRLGALPTGVDPYLYASSVWCFDKVREAGGLGVFCHPYWFTQHRYSPAGALTSHLFETQPFDAFELIGGFHRHEADSNTLQVARYHEERARGRRIPIVGASDAHGCERGELFGWYYTVVFSPTPELKDLTASVKALYSVAVEALPGETARVYGPFRYVKYALYLLREALPAHDELCMEEGRLMAAYLAGDKGAAQALEALKGRTRAQFDLYRGGV
jgi:hypothetical protein